MLGRENSVTGEALRMTRRILLAVLVAASAPALVAAQTTAPAVIKSMSADEARGYLAGDGLGMAKAGELNHYPGPKHVLAIADHLRLSDGQKAAVEKVEVTMSVAAIPLGREIVDAEVALDRAFANGSIDEATVTALAERIGDLQGRLRAVHLSAHLATRRLLTAEQISMYDRMRGNDGGAGMHNHGR